MTTGKAIWAFKNHQRFIAGPRFIYCDCLWNLINKVPCALSNEMVKILCNKHTAIGQFAKFRFYSSDEAYAGLYKSLFWQRLCSVKNIFWSTFFWFAVVWISLLEMNLLAIGGLLVQQLWHQVAEKNISKNLKVIWVLIKQIWYLHYVGHHKLRVKSYRGHICSNNTETLINI